MREKKTHEIKTWLNLFDIQIAGVLERANKENKNKDIILEIEN